MSILRRSIEDLKDEATRLHIDHLQEESLGNVIVLSAAPATGALLLNDNQIGIYSNELYWRSGSVVYKFSSDEQIS